MLYSMVTATLENCGLTEVNSLRMSANLFVEQVLRPVASAASRRTERYVEYRHR